MLAAQNSPIFLIHQQESGRVRRHPGEHIWVREEVGHHAAAGTLQRLQEGWAIKERGENLLGTCLRFWAI